MARIYRIRYIPSETNDLSADELLYRDEDFLITRWKPIRQRNDIAGGISCLFLKKGWKISAMWDHNNQLIYWYCDILDINYEVETDTYHLYDLLIDIAIMPDNQVKILDIDELGMAFDKNLITKSQLVSSLGKSNELLTFIYNNDAPYIFRDIILKNTGIKI